MAIRSYGLATANSFVKVHRFVRKAIPTGERTILTNQDIRHSLQRRQSPCANALIRRSTSLHPCMAVDYCNSWFTSRRAGRDKMERH